jgi:hypothetical protein
MGVQECQAIREGGLPRKPSAPGEQEEGTTPLFGRWPRGLHGGQHVIDAVRVEIADVEPARRNGTQCTSGEPMGPENPAVLAERNKFAADNCQAVRSPGDHLP